MLPSIFEKYKICSNRTKSLPPGDAFLEIEIKTIATFIPWR